MYIYMCIYINIYIHIPARTCWTHCVWCWQSAVGVRARLAAGGGGALQHGHLTQYVD